MKQMLFLWLALVTGCSSSTLYRSATVAVPLGPPDAYSCARQQLKSLGYRETSHDDDAHRVKAQKENTTLKVSSTMLRKVYDRLIVEIAADAKGSTSFEVEAHSIREYSNQQGITEEEVEASPEVQADASALLKQCQGQAASKDSLPQGN
jgi:hypothetical protein